MTNRFLPEIPEIFFCYDAAEAFDVAHERGGEGAVVHRLRALRRYGVQGSGQRRLHYHIPLLPHFVRRWIHVHFSGNNQP